MRIHEDPPLNVVLYEPQIPPNTGNIARLCAAVRCHLILLGKLGFELTDSQLKRAGLDYWQWVSWEYFEEPEAFLQNLPETSIRCLSVHVALYSNESFSRGLPLFRQGNDRASQSMA